MLRRLLLLAIARLAAQAPNLTKIAASGKPGTTKSAGCNSFAPPRDTKLQFICEVESPEHYLVRKYLPRNATVLEFGGRTAVVRRRGGKRTKQAVRIAARPYMRPALEKEAPNLPKVWRNSVRGG